MRPPPYPRTPYLLAPVHSSGSDRVVPSADVSGWLRTPVLVEEKLDGANVSLWLEEGQIQVASRGGVGAMDRAGQLGRLRAWAAKRSGCLATLLADGWAAYGEWLWLRHGTAYDLLPDYLFVLDCWHQDAGMAPTSERDARASASGLHTPPVRHSGTLPDLAGLLALLGPSAYAAEQRAEGLVVRRAADDARCKVVDPLYRRPDDRHFAAGQHNALTVR